jgi:hypothetical protein
MVLSRTRLYGPGWQIFSLKGDFIFRGIGVLPYIMGPGSGPDVSEPGVPVVASVLLRMIDGLGKFRAMLLVYIRGTCCFLVDNEVVSEGTDTRQGGRQ